MVETYSKGSPVTKYPIFYQKTIDFTKSIVF